MPDCDGHDQDPQVPRPGLIVDLEAIDLDREGRGLARWNSWVVVVPDLLPGERARVQLQQRQKAQWLSRRLELQHHSPERRSSPCILAKDCGGCTLQHWQDDAQTQWKQRSLEQTLQRVGSLSHEPEAVLVNRDRCLGYRNRALIPLRREPDGRLRMGYFRRGSHRIVNLNRCPVLDARLDPLLEPLKRDLERSALPADHDLQGRDGLRHLGLRIGHHTGEVLISLISSREDLPELRELATRWLSRWPSVRGVTLNLQPKRSNLILGAETRLLGGSPCIEERFCGLSLSLGTTTFFQINTPQAERIVGLIRDWFAAELDSGCLVDAYCGIGTISLPLAAAGFDLVGVELNPDSIEQARSNARMNGLHDRCRFVAGDVADHLGQALAGCDGLVLDPPRRGLDDRVIEAILGSPPPLLAYLSCDAATQARDLRRLVGPSGCYRLERLQPIDFFPQTSHLESLALLKRISS